MSGVLIKMGIYGIVRISGILPHPPIWWGSTLLVLGCVSGVLGVVFAIAQHDLKRLLAYHSIENIGIIVMGLGLALVGRGRGRVDWIVLGMAGALLHVWNHGLFKSLLFFSAGSVIHATGTRQIDRMGGLAKPMPKTAMLFTIGAVAICGLPPLNGFVSEFLIYIGLFRTLGLGEAPWLWGTLAAPVLAMIGALAVACFVKIVGVVFLGEPRTDEARHGHEAPASMTSPMVLIASLCFAIGLLPILIAPVMDRAIRAWAGDIPLQPVMSWAPLGWISAMALALGALGAAGYIALRRRISAGAFTKVGTWDCGYAAPTARMQYTASSFAQMLVGIFGGVLRPRVHRPKLEGVFPASSHFESHVEDAAMKDVIEPSLSWIERMLSSLRFLQQGRVQLYLLYILIVVVVLLLV